MHSEHDDSGTWTFYYDGDGHLIAPDAIVGDAHASPQTAPLLAHGTYVFRSSATGDDRLDPLPAATALDGDPFVFTPGRYGDLDGGYLLAPRRCRCCEHQLPGRWLSQDPAGLFDDVANLYRYPADAPHPPDEGGGS